MRWQRARVTWRPRGLFSRANRVLCSELFGIHQTVSLMSNHLFKKKKPLKTRPVSLFMFCRSKLLVWLPVVRCGTKKAGKLIAFTGRLYGCCSAVEQSGFRADLQIFTVYRTPDYRNHSEIKCTSSTGRPRDR